MNNERRTWRNNGLIAHKITQSHNQIYFTITGSNPVFSHRYIHSNRFCPRIQNDNGIQPRVTVGSSLQTKCHHIICRSTKKLQMSAHLFRISQPESRMCLPFT